MGRFWTSFQEGKGFRIAFLWILRTLAVLIALAGVVYWGAVWVSIIRRATVGLVIGWFVAELPYLVAVVAVAWTLWHRGGKVYNVPDGNYPVFDVTAIILRLGGEISALIMGLGGLVGMILIWISGQQFGIFLRFFGRFMGQRAFRAPAGRFLAGLAAGVVNIVEAFVVLLVFYFLAEAIMMLKDIYANTRAIRNGDGPAYDEEPLP